MCSTRPPDLGPVRCAEHARRTHPEHVRLAPRASRFGSAPPHNGLGAWWLDSTVAHVCHLVARVRARSCADPHAPARTMVATRTAVRSDELRTSACDHFSVPGRRAPTGFGNAGELIQSGQAWCPGRSWDRVDRFPHETPGHARVAPGTPRRDIAGTAVTRSGRMTGTNVRRRTRASGNGPEQARA